MTSISARPYRGARPFTQAYPGKGKLLKGAKNIPGVLQSYVTYDTLRQHVNFANGPILTIRPGKALQ
jgi:hypothetical protein